MNNKSPFYFTLPFEIMMQPKPIGIELINTKRKYDDVIERWDDICLIINVRQEKFGLLGYGLFLIGALFFYDIIILLGQGINEFIESLKVGIPIVSIVLIMIVCALTSPEKKLILNRLKGTAVLPGFLYQKSLKLSFNDIIPVVTKVTRIGTKGTELFLKRPIGRWYDRFQLGTIFRGNQSDPFESWSLLVWYMDKNRPLPPGTAFDPYRKRDEERRKKEGYPPPLYPSRIHNEQGILYPTEKSYGG